MFTKTCLGRTSHLDIQLIINSSDSSLKDYTKGDEPGGIREKKYQISGNLKLR